VEEKRLEVEERKFSLLREWLQAQQQLGNILPLIRKPWAGGNAARVEGDAALESERAKLKEDITAEVTEKFEAVMQEKLEARRRYFLEEMRASYASIWPRRIAIWIQTTWQNWQWNCSL
jgi:hypothetical protein